MTIVHKLALFDIDGVLADETHRAQHAIAGDFGMYFQSWLVEQDDVFREGRFLYECCDMLGFDLGYLTGRREDLRAITTAWLSRCGFAPDLPLIMRHPRHRTSQGWPLSRLKAEIVRELTYVYDQVWLFDDDPAVCAAVAEVPGAYARHCTWHIKPEQMVRRAVA